MEKALVGIVMGSDSDWPLVKKACDTLDGFGVAYETRVISAHRTPELAVEYSKTAADTKSRIRDLAWMNGRFFIFFAIFVLPVSAYFLVIGFLAGVNEMVTTGLQTLTLFGVLIAVYITVYVKTKKAVTMNFDKLAENDKIDFTLEKVDDSTLQFTRLTDGEVITVNILDIKSIKRLKTITVIVLKNKKMIDLPKRSDIDEMISFT